MALTIPHSLLLPTTFLLSLSLFLLFFSLLLKTHKKKRPFQNPHSHSNQTLEEQEKAKPKEKEEEERKNEGTHKVEEKKRKKRTRKKKHEEAETGGTGTSNGTGTETKCPFPFSSFESGTQRKIKLKYDELVRSNDANALTSSQVTQFIDCLIEARNELQHKSQLIQRSFKIKKALLSKADRSSFDRLCNQVFKLETEHKRLQEDAAVYNVLQEQLKLSPAYKTLIEISARMKSEDKDETTDFSDISFEELLAQEKKDSFWQKNGKMRSFAN